MADVFVSYARSDKTRVAPLVAAIQAQGWSVWWDPEIDAGQQFDDQIEVELKAAKAVLVVWTPISASSRWVRGEARRRRTGHAGPRALRRHQLPMDVRRFTPRTSMAGRRPQSAPFSAAAALSAVARKGAPRHETPGKPSAVHHPALGDLVLPFANMSGDVDQEYFSDGISEDIITDLSKVSALAVASRNSAFMYKGKQVDVPKVARELKVSHVLEGSVRKAGGRVRITAQLVDGSSNDSIWAERYDRDLNDIFALQDEISQAIVKALKLKLLPEEKKAIERRGTESVDAYNLYLMAAGITPPAIDTMRTPRSFACAPPGNDPVMRTGMMAPGRCS
jgi:adenylate cyclase